MTNWTRYSATRLVNGKNVYYADYSGQKVVLKKFAHDFELQALDETICKKSKIERPKCRPEHHIRFLTSRVSVDSKFKTLDLTGLKTVVETTDNDFTGCFRSQSLLDFLVKRATYHAARPSLDHILTMILANPEPLVLMSFPSEEGWKFPKYYGSCGRLAVVEYCGRRLSEFGQADFKVRARLSAQLLQMAFDLTKNMHGLALYLTDWSTDNFAVDHRNVLTVIDLEHVVIVDQSLVRETSAPGWNVPHTSASYGCSDCFSYSLEDLCSHETSDNNLFGVCQGILAPNAFSTDIPEGLLHSIPENIRLSHPLLPRLVTECGTPSQPGGRFEAAIQLLEILKQI